LFTPLTIVVTRLSSSHLGHVFDCPQLDIEQMPRHDAGSFRWWCHQPQVGSVKPRFISLAGELFALGKANAVGAAISR
jgi:hypothetical protein